MADYILNDGEESGNLSGRRCKICGKENDSVMAFSFVESVHILCRNNKYGGNGRIKTEENKRLKNMKSTKPFFIVVEGILYAQNKRINE